MTRAILALAVAGLTLTACEGFKDALTAHVDVAARAGSQELSVDHLGELLAQVNRPATPDIAKTVANVWVDYQLAAQAAAQNDSLTDPDLMNKALWPVITQQRLSKWHTVLMQRSPVDTANAEAQYAAGDVLAASHILFAVPKDATPAVRDSVRRQAMSVRRQLTAANFAAMAHKYSKDFQSAQQGGKLGVFPRGVMVKEFEQGLLALKPGEISQPIETQFGYHIIRRATYDEVKADVNKAIVADHVAQTDSLYMTGLLDRSHVQFKDDAAAVIKTAGKDLEGHRDDGTVLATSSAGDFTVGQFVKWLDLYQDRARISQGIQQAPDSVVLQFAREVLTRDLVLHEVDSANVTLDSAQTAMLHATFARSVGAAWEGLGVEPSSLADSAKTERARERLASARVDQYIDKLVTNKARFIQVPGPLEVALRAKYAWKVNDAGLDHAVRRAGEIKLAADSASAASRPKTAVPIGSGAPSASTKPTP
jgi:hypothetical protein